MRSVTDSRLALMFDRPEVRLGSVALLSAFLLFARRYAQMLNPQVWQEEGVIVSQFVTHGAASLFLPLNGYLVIASRLVSLVALVVPFKEYPRAAATLTWAFIVTVCVAVALVPSRLRGGTLIALALLLVPSKAEVYGTPLYVFWWTIPLLYAAYFWTPRGAIAWWRVGAIVTSGLSAPAIVLAAPLFVVKALLRRSSDTAAAAVAAAGCALIQLAVIAHSAADLARPSWRSFEPVLKKVIGGYLVWNVLPPTQERQVGALVAGGLTLVFLAVALARERSLRNVLAVLGYLWIGSILLSVTRVDAAILDPAGDGPRYFFLPFFVEGWLLLQIAFGAHDRTLRTIAALMLACSAFNALPVLSRPHADLGWKASVDACSAAPGATLFAIPIEVDGSARHHWSLALHANVCRRLERFGYLGLLAHW